MGVLKKIDYVVKKADFFYSRDMLRYEDEEEYKTFTGGITSIGIIIAIVIGFASMILDTLNLTSISTSTQVIKNVIPPSSTIQITPDSPFRFGVEVWHLNLSDTKRYFDVTFSIMIQTNGVLVDEHIIPLEACTREYFAGYPDVLSGFQKLGAGGWLCPPMNTTLDLYGKYSSDSYSLYIVTASACNNDTDPSRPCASPEQIQSYFDQNFNALYFTLYFTNPQINPAEKDYKQYYLEDMSYVLFGSHMGSETFIYFADYTVETDYSIWPYKHVVKDQGCIVEQQAINHPFQTNINGTYVTFNLAKSPNSIIYKRQVQKLSSVFSFIGGMIGAVSAVLFVLKLYTNLAFEFSISLQIFGQQKKVKNQGKESQKSISQPKQNISMNLWNFIRYTVYRFSNLIKRPCNWPVMKYAHECNQQISKQLDVKLLLKRIIFIEHCLTHLIEDYQLDALQISKPVLPSEIREIRQKCESVLDSKSQSSDSAEYQVKKEGQEEIQVKNGLKNEESLSSPANLVESLDEKLPPVKPSQCFSKKNSINLQVIAQNSSGSVSEAPIVDLDKIKREDIFPIYLVSKKGDSDLKITSVKNGDKKHQKRQSFLSQLEKSALKGDRLSRRIWGEVQELTNHKIERESEIDST